MEYKGMYWMDTSVKHRMEALDHVMANANNMQGIGFVFNTFHSTYAVTDPGMYEYFITDEEKQKEYLQLAATVYVLFRTKEVWNNIFQWVLLCSLDLNCIAPNDAVNRFYPCPFRKGLMVRRDGCHRFDQSLLNLVISNFYNFDKTYLDVGRSEDIVQLIRGDVRTTTMPLCINAN